MAWKDRYSKSPDAVGLVDEHQPEVGVVKLSDSQINHIKSLATTQDGKTVFRVKSSASDKYAWFRTTGDWSDTGRCWGQDVRGGQGKLTSSKSLPTTDWQDFAGDYLEYYHFGARPVQSADRYFMGMTRRAGYHSCFVAGSSATWSDGGSERCFSGGSQYNNHAPLPDVEVWMLLDDGLASAAATAAADSLRSIVNAMSNVPFGR